MTSEDVEILEKRDLYRSRTWKNGITYEEVLFYDFQACGNYADKFPWRTGNNLAQVGIKLLQGGKKLKTPGYYLHVFLG